MHRRIQAQDNKFVMFQNEFKIRDKRISDLQEMVIEQRAQLQEGFTKEIAILHPKIAEFQPKMDELKKEIIEVEKKQFGFLDKCSIIEENMLELQT